MNRRGFIARLGSLPVVGKLLGGAALAHAGIDWASGESRSHVAVFKTCFVSNDDAIKAEVLALRAPPDISFGCVARAREALYERRRFEACFDRNIPHATFFDLKNDGVTFVQCINEIALLPQIYD